MVLYYIIDKKWVDRNLAKSDNHGTAKSIVEAFKEVLMEKDFKDIRIKDITDAADLFRATFYTYFPDKYAIFDTILYEDLFNVVDSLVEAGMYKQSLEFIFNYFLNNREFYKRAFKYEGPDSCQHYLKAYLKEYFKTLIAKSSNKIKSEYKELTNKDNFAELCAETLFIVINYIVTTDSDTEHIDRKIRALHLFFTSGLKPFFE